MGSNTALELHEVKGVLTKVMRMLFPLEFRIDSLANFSNALPFRFPFATGEVIHLPESVDGLGSHDNSFDYYLMLATHLAGRHEFGTYEIRLADLPGFEERGETGVEAIDSFVASFDDPGHLGDVLAHPCGVRDLDFGDRVVLHGRPRSFHPGARLAGLAGAGVIVRRGMLRLGSPSQSRDVSARP